MKIILDAYIRHGQKYLMAKVYDGEELIHAQTAPAAQLREIMSSAVKFLSCVMI